MGDIFEQQPGPFKPVRRPSKDSLEEPVTSNQDKKKKAKEVGRRLTVLERQLYGTNSGYGADSAEHELDHALADKNGKGRFRLRATGNAFSADIVPGYETEGVRSPRKRMQIASSVKEMSDHDRQVYNKAQAELGQQRIKALKVAALVASPGLCYGILYLATHIIK